MNTYLHYITGSHIITIVAISGMFTNHTNINFLNFHEFSRVFANPYHFVNPYHLNIYRSNFSRMLKQTHYLYHSDTTPFVAEVRRDNIINDIPVGLEVF